MKKNTLMGVMCLLLSTLTFAQSDDDFKPEGKMEGRIFTNFNTSLTESDSKGFELQRAYFGYQYKFAPFFSAKVRIDVAGAEFITPEINNQYVFFKTAAVYYDKDRWKLGFGLQDTYQFKVQESLWGKRYILPSMLDRQKFNFSADIGFAVGYSLENFDFDLSLFNGEGYKQFQSDNAFRTSLGITSFLMDKKIILRGYTDVSTSEVKLFSVTGFAGLDLDKFTFGIEYTYQQNYIYTDGHNRTGFSLFSQYNFTPKFGLWVRFDDLNSDFNMDDADYIDKWLKRDGLDTFLGLEYLIVPKHLSSSLNYQQHTPDGEGNANSSFIFLNLEIKF